MHSPFLSASLPKLKPDTASIDTVEMLFFRYPPKGLRSQVEAALGRPVRIQECRDRTGFVWAYRLTVHQPNLQTLAVLDWFQQRHPEAKVFRFDLAMDWIKRTQALAEGLKYWLSTALILRWRPPGPMYADEGTGETIYWVHQARRTRYEHKRRSARDVTLYTKTIADAACTRLELKHYGTCACDRQCIIRPTDLTKINPRQHLDKHLRLAFGADAYVEQTMAVSVKAGMPAPRVRSIIRRSNHDRAQRIKDTSPEFVSKTVPISSILWVPDHLTWPCSDPPFR
jgi:hypothetical protein